jgi:hypothetical protein
VCERVENASNKNKTKRIKFRIYLLISYLVFHSLVFYFILINIQSCCYFFHFEQINFLLIFKLINKNLCLHLCLIFRRLFYFTFKIKIILNCIRNNWVKIAVYDFLYEGISLFSLKSQTLHFFFILASFKW